MCAQDGETEQQSDVEGSELLEQKEETNITQTQTRIKLPNPFRKSKTLQEEGRFCITAFVSKKFGDLFLN